MPAKNLERGKTNRLFSQYQGQGGGAVFRRSSPGGTTAVRKPITVTSVEWTGVTANYPDAPNLGTLYEATLNHGLGDVAADATYMLDEDGFHRRDFFSQPTDANNTTVWLSWNPSSDVVFYIWAFV